MKFNDDGVCNLISICNFWLKDEMFKEIQFVLVYLTRNRWELMQFIFHVVFILRIMNDSINKYEYWNKKLKIIQI